MDQDKDDRQHHNTQHNISVSVKESHQNLTAVTRHFDKLQFISISKATKAVQTNIAHKHRFEHFIANK